VGLRPLLFRFSGNVLEESPTPTTPAPAESTAAAAATKTATAPTEAVVAVIAAEIEVRVVVRSTFGRQIATRIGRRDNGSLVSIGIAQVGEIATDDCPSFGIQLRIRVVGSTLDNDGERGTPHAGCHFHQMVLAVRCQVRRFTNKINEIEDEVGRFCVCLLGMKVRTDNAAQREIVGDHIAFICGNAAATEQPAAKKASATKGS
jgi:hypothetical protein